MTAGVVGVSGLPNGVAPAPGRSSHSFEPPPTEHVLGTSSAEQGGAVSELKIMPALPLLSTTGNAPIPWSPNSGWKMLPLTVDQLASLSQPAPAPAVWS